MELGLCPLIGRQRCHITSRSCGGPHNQSRPIQTVDSQAAVPAGHCGPSGTSVPECLEMSKIGLLISPRKDCAVEYA